MDKPLQRIDHLMWDAESPSSLVTIAGIFIFKKKLNKEKLIDMIRKRLLRYERFQKKVILKKGTPVWHMDEQFELPTHIHHISLPGKGGHKELQECISDLISQPLNHSKPLWDVHLIDNYKKGCVLLCRIHHAMGDGMALIKVIFSLTGISAKDSLSELSQEENTKDVYNKREKQSLQQVAPAVYADARKLISQPSLLRDRLKNNWTTVREIGELLLGKPLKNTIYKGNLGLAKKAVWTEPLSLETFKALSKHHKVKINDILLALVAGALRKHLQLHKHKAEEGLKVVVPINMRKDSEIKNIHNEFGWISLDLPVHISSFKKRLAAIRQKTVALKPSAEPMILNQLLHIVADYTPPAAKELFMDYMGTRIAGVITNVPGPDHPIYMAGEKVEDLVFWIPHTSTLGIGISLMSYNGKVYMGVVTDEGLVKDPEVIIDSFITELNLLKEQMISSGR